MGKFFGKKSSKSSQHESRRNEVRSGERTSGASPPSPKAMPVKESSGSTNGAAASRGPKPNASNPPMHPANPPVKVEQSSGSTNGAAARRGPRPNTSYPSMHPANPPMHPVNPPMSPVNPSPPQTTAYLPPPDYSFVQEIDEAFEPIMIFCEWMNTGVNLKSDYDH